DDDAALLAELARLEPREILLAAELPDLARAIGRILPSAAIRVGPAVAEVDVELARFLGDDYARLAAHEAPLNGRCAAVLALRYAEEARPGAKLEVDALVRYDPREHLVLDEVAVRNLELVRTLNGDRKGSLLALLDGTSTAMGARLLRRWLLAPLVDLAAIRRRHDGVESLVIESDLRAELRALLGRVSDLERL